MSPGRFNAQPPRTIVIINRGADGGGFPAGRGGVKPDGRNRHDAAPGSARLAARAANADEHPGNQRECAGRQWQRVHRAGAQERFADVGGQGGSPAERSSPKATARVVFHRQAQRERVLRPVQKPVGQRRMSQRRTRPVASRWWNRFELVKNPARFEIFAIVEQSLGKGGGGRPMTRIFPPADLRKSDVEHARRHDHDGTAAGCQSAFAAQRHDPDANK